MLKHSLILQQNKHRYEAQLEARRRSVGPSNGSLKEASAS